MEASDQAMVLGFSPARKLLLRAFKEMISLRMVIVAAAMIGLCALSPFGSCADASTYRGQHYGVVDQWGTDGSGTDPMSTVFANLGAKHIRSGWDWDLVERHGDDQYDEGYLALMDNWATTMHGMGAEILYGFSYTPPWAAPDGIGHNTPPSDPTRYTDFIAFMVNRYKDRIKDWGFWNEVNIDGFWNGTDTNYIHNYLIPGIAAVKAADPTARTVVGELASCCNELSLLQTTLNELTAHGMKDLVDVVCVHAYGEGDTAAGRLARMDTLHDMIVAAGYGDKEFWCTETSYGGSGTSGEANQAAQITQFMLGMDSRPWWTKTFYFTLSQAPDADQGLVRSDLSLKPAYIQYQQLIADHADNASQVSNTIPSTMVAGRQYYVSVTVRNVGTSTWTEDSEIRLGAIGDSDPFAAGRIYLGPSESVAPDATKTFWFTMTAPTTTGSYTTDWQMVHEAVHWFGHPLVKTVNVNNGPDTMPPGPVAGFTATPGDFKVTLSWQNPTDADFTGTRIRFKTTGYPTSVSDGTFLIDKSNNPGTSDSYIHTGRTNGVTYYYSAFAHDPVVNYASKADASATATDNEPPASVSQLSITSTANQNSLSWTNPGNSDYVGTLIRFRTDTYPTGPTNGTLLCNRSAQPGSDDSYVHSGIDNGTTYYYAAYAYDEVPNHAAPATANGTPVGPRVTISSSVFTSAADGWAIFLWKAEPPNANAQMYWNSLVGRTGGGIRCIGGGITDDAYRCLREGGELSKTISTAGHEKIQVSYDLRVNSLGGNYTGTGTGGCLVDHDLIDDQLTVFFSTDAGANWAEAEHITRAALLGYQSWGTRLIDLSEIPGCNNNSDFALRFRWQFNSESDTGDIDNVVVTGTTLGPPDVTSPAAVTNFLASPSDKRATLSWTNPSDTDFMGTLIRFKTTGYPTNESDGTLVCDRTKAPGSTDSFIHTGLTNGVTYYYAAFAYDEIPNYATRAIASAAPVDTFPPSNVSGFSAIRGNTRNTLIWYNPGTADFTGTTIRFKTSGYPSGPTDGTLVVDKIGVPSTGETYVHEELTNGITYYYRAYSHDAAPNYASGVGATGSPAYFDPYDAKLLADYATAVLSEGVVSASFADMFYTQSPDRLAGIRVDQTGHSLQVGQSVGVRGTVLTDPETDERYVFADWSLAHASASVPAIAMGAGSVGGVAWNYDSGSGAGQKGLASASGPNNIGLLVRVWGKVTQRQTAQPQYFYIDDGSGLTDGTATAGVDNVGIRILADPAAYSPGDYVVVTGVSSCFKNSAGEVRPQIRPASIDKMGP